MKKIATFEEFVNENLNESSDKQKFIIYTNPNNVTNYAYAEFGNREVKETLSAARQYPGSYWILYQGKGTIQDMEKIKKDFSNYKFA